MHVLLDHFITNINFNHYFNQTFWTCFLLNNNFNHNFNQTHILIKTTTTKSDFSKLTFFIPQSQKLPQYQTHLIIIPTNFFLKILKNHNKLIKIDLRNLFTNRSDPI